MVFVLLNLDKRCIFIGKPSWLGGHQRAVGRFAGSCKPCSWISCRLQMLRWTWLVCVLSRLLFQRPSLV